MIISVKTTITSEVDNCYSCPLSLPASFKDSSGKYFRQCAIATKLSMFKGAAIMIPDECPAKSSIKVEKDSNCKTITIIQVEK